MDRKSVLPMKMVIYHIYFSFSICEEHVSGHCGAIRSSDQISDITLDYHSNVISDIWHILSVMLHVYQEEFSFNKNNFLEIMGFGWTCVSYAS